MRWNSQADIREVYERIVISHSQTDRYGDQYELPVTEYLEDKTFEVKGRAYV